MKKNDEEHTHSTETAPKSNAVDTPAAQELESTEGLPVIFPSPGAIGTFAEDMIPAHLKDLYPIISSGRPSKLTPELSVKILGLICEGHSLNVCCQAVGIDDQTLRNWKAKGEEGKQPYATFVRACKIARAAGEVGLLREARAAGKGEWTKYITILERTRPERWSSRQRIEVEKHVSIHVDAPPAAAEDVATWQARRAARQAGEITPRAQIDTSELSRTDLENDELAE